jgi:hypothetical protein
MLPKFLILGCKTMREGVLVAAIFFVAAVLLFLAAQHVLPKGYNLEVVVLALALGLMVLSPVVLVSTFLLSVIPGARDKLDQCDH